MRADERTDKITKLTVAFRNCGMLLKIPYIRHVGNNDVLIKIYFELKAVLVSWLDYS